MRYLRSLCCYSVIAASLWFSALVIGQETRSLQKITDDIDTKFTRVGNIGLTITNFGTIGARNNYWPTQLSCEYPRGSLIEHLYQGGLWVGGVLSTSDSRNGEIYVTTATSDRTVTSSASHLIQGVEFTSENGDSISQFSTLTDERPPGSQFAPGAVSHQDMVCNYSDLHTRVPATLDSISDHTPLGLKIHQESYAWNFPFTDFFVILRYVIQNVSKDTLDSVYVGLWNDPVVRNTNLVRPGTPGYFNWTGNGYDPQVRMAYSFDFNGTPGKTPANSYVGFRLLGTTPFPTGIDSLGDLTRNTFYNAWVFRPSDPSSLGNFKSPTDDWNSDPIVSRYSRMTQSMPDADIASLRVTPRNVCTLLSVGPYSRLFPGQSIEVVFGVTCAKKLGLAPPYFDTRDQRKTLYINSEWAQKAYNGEDVNGNNLLDAGEDIATRDSLGLRYEPDHQITRYLLPAPPRKPKVRVEVNDQSVVLYWDKATAEESVDPISAKRNFEGYRIYRSSPGSDFLNHDDFTLNYALIGEFDRPDDAIGYNTGFAQITLDTPKTFPGDTAVYWYRFPPKGVTLEHLNGWQYIYGVSAFSTGDSALNVPSLESAKTLFRVVPGTPPTSDKSKEVGVYPNPYYVNAYWDGGRERLRKIYFYNLPAKCQIRVYTIAGDVVTVIDHDATSYNGSGINWFDQFGDAKTNAQFAGGEHAWDLISKWDQAIATGLYLFTVEDKATGDIKRGKFMIVK